MRRVKKHSEYCSWIWIVYGIGEEQANKLLFVAKIVFKTLSIVDLDLNASKFSMVDRNCHHTRVVVILIGLASSSSHFSSIQWIWPENT
jgi:hypothetical protein